MPEPQDTPVKLPPRIFLYTLDQIALMLDMSETGIRAYCHLDKLHTGPRPPSRLLARNIADNDKHPDWRITEKELRRWMRLKGFRVVTRDSWEE